MCTGRRDREKGESSKLEGTAKKDVSADKPVVRRPRRTTAALPSDPVLSALPVSREYFSVAMER